MTPRDSNEALPPIRCRVCIFRTTQGGCNYSLQAVVPGQRPGRLPRSVLQIGVSGRCPPSVQSEKCKVQNAEGGCLLNQSARNRSQFSGCHLPERASATMDCIARALASVHQLRDLTTAKRLNSKAQGRRAAAHPGSTFPSNLVRRRCSTTGVRNRMLAVSAK